MAEKIEGVDYTGDCWSLEHDEAVPGQIDLHTDAGMTFWSEDDLCRVRAFIDDVLGDRGQPARVSRLAAASHAVLERALRLALVAGRNDIEPTDMRAADVELNGPCVLNGLTIDGWRDVARRAEKAAADASEERNAMVRDLAAAQQARARANHDSALAADRAAGFERQLADIAKIVKPTAIESAWQGVKAVVDQRDALDEQYAEAQQEITLLREQKADRFTRAEVVDIVNRYDASTGATTFTRKLDRAIADVRMARAKAEQDGPPAEPERVYVALDMARAPAKRVTVEVRSSRPVPAGTSYVSTGYAVWRLLGLTRDPQTVTHDSALEPSWVWTFHLEAVDPHDVPLDEVRIPEMRRPIRVLEATDRLAEHQDDA